MSNDLTAYLGGGQLQELDPNVMAQGLAETIEETGVGPGNVDFLYFSGKSGLWTVGRDRDQPDPEEFWLISPEMIFKGWVCWKDNKRADSIEWSIYNRDGEVDEVELPDHGPYRASAGEGWAKQLGLMMVRCETLRQVKFSTSSVSGRNSISDLMGELHRRSVNGEPIYPIVTLGSQEFEAQGQWNHKPMFPVEAWTTLDSAKAFVAGDISIDELVTGAPPKRRIASKKKVTKKKVGRRR